MGNSTEAGQREADEAYGHINPTGHATTIMNSDYTIFDKLDPG
jgi:hypothetical protein